MRKKHQKAVLVVLVMTGQQEEPGVIHVGRDHFLLGRAHPSSSWWISSSSIDLSDLPGHIWGFPKSWGYPYSWMVFVREIPSIIKDDDWGYPYDLGNHH